MKPKLSFSQVLISWFKGIYGKLNRWVSRRLRPNLGKRKDLISSDVNSSPLSGISQFRNPGSLTVQELMAKVQWQLPKKTQKTVSTVREEINWD
jgi:hypothetical protein